MTEPGRRRGAPAERVAAVVLLTAPPVISLGVLAACVAAALLVPLGLWRPAAVAPVLVAVAALAWRLRGWLPLPGAGRGPRVPPWTAAACVLIAVAFGVWAGLTHGEHLVLRRDAGSYALYAHWLATHHGLPVAADLPAFGGQAALAVPGFTLDSPAYYQVLTGDGARIDPQFLLGAPALYATGWWVAGWTGLFVAPAVVGALAVLAAASVAARIAGPRWAPLAALALALTQPFVHAARATYSEPVATLLVLGAAALATDALATDALATDAPATDAMGESREPRQVRRLAVLAGGLLGLAGLVRIDALREVALVLPVCALLRLRRHPAAVPLGVTALAGAALAFVPAVVLARPYLHTVEGSLRPLLVIAAASAVLSVGVVALHSWWERRHAAGADAGSAAGSGSATGAWVGARLRAVTRLLPAAAAGLVVAAGLVLASRPLWTTTRQAPDDPGNALVASLQAQQHLPVDPSRTYAERSVEWVLWYTGVPAAVLALLALAGAAAVAVRRWTGRDRFPDWLLPAAVGLGSAALTLYRPGITPDHPWADRRLVPIVLPLVAIGAVSACAVAARAVASVTAPRGPRAVRAARAATVLVAAAAVLVPAYEGTKALATVRTEVGEPGAVADVCRRLRPGDVVVGVADSRGRTRAQNEWVQVVRGVCGRPSAALRPSGGEPVDVGASARRLAGLVRQAGGRLVLLSAAEDDGAAKRALTGLGLQPERAVLHRTTEDQHLLVRRPDERSGLVIDVWLAVQP